MTTYQREGKNKHDDAPDAVTGIVETLANDNQVRFINIRRCENVSKQFKFKAV